MPVLTRGILSERALLQAYVSADRGYETNNTTVNSCLFGTTSGGAWVGDKASTYALVLRHIQATCSTAATITITEGSTTLLVFKMLGQTWSEELFLPIAVGAALKVELKYVGGTTGAIIAVASAYGV